ncbi:MAG: hypothetical protein KF722_10355 [Nitrospira sp.]|nr:hypothetical protein [Nitrospira sp.]
MMLRHPRYLEIPWQVHWDQRDQKEGGPHHRLLLILTLIFMAMFLIGIGVTSGLM